jgi:hypothetical protein
MKPHVRRIKDIRDPEGRRIGYVTSDGNAWDFAGRFVGTLKDDSRIHNSAGKILDVRVTRLRYSRLLMGLIVLLLLVALALEIVELPVACGCNHIETSMRPEPSR